jgi:hypothetical protein
VNLSRNTEGVGEWYRNLANTFGVTKMARASVTQGVALG